MNPSPESAVLLALVDGRRVAPGAPALPAAALGVLRGEGVFETFLVEDGRPTPFLAWHAQRLQAGVRALEFAGYTRSLVEEFEELRPHLPGDGRWRSRFTLLRGCGSELVRVWTVHPVESPPAEISLAISPWRRDPLDPLAGVKTISRAGAQAARRRAVQEGAWDALHVTTDGDLAECSSSNLFLWKSGRLFTPPTDRGILAGVTRAAIVRGCFLLGLPVVEARLGKEDLAQAAEVYVTSSVMGILPVAKILRVREDLPGRRGIMIEKIRSAYRHCVAAQIGTIGQQERDANPTSPFPPDRPCP